MDGKTDKILTKIKQNFKNNRSAQFLGKCIEVIGNEERFNILNLLKSKAYSVTELESILNRNKSSISHHIKILERRGLIKGTKNGKFIEYTVLKEHFLKLTDAWNEWFEFVA